MYASAQAGDYNVKHRKESCEKAGVMGQWQPFDGCVPIQPRGEGQRQMCFTMVPSHCSVFKWRQQGHKQAPLEHCCSTGTIQSGGLRCIQVRSYSPT